MNRKTELKWLTVFALVSVCIIGVMTDFTYRNLEIQMHDTYFVVDPLKGFIFLTFTLWTIKNLYLLVDLMTDRYKIIAVLVSIINPLIALLILILTYWNIQSFLTLRETYPAIGFSRVIVPVCFLAGVIGLQALIEIRALKKLAGIFK